MIRRRNSRGTRLVYEVWVHLRAAKKRLSDVHAMKYFQLSNYESKTKIIAGSIVALVVAAVGFLYFGLAIAMVFIPTVVVGFAAYRIHLHRLQIKTAQIMEASRIHLATVEALATAIDARDQIGAGHVRRTQIFAVGLGELFKLSDDELNALRTGALLHDIGKLAIPDHILSKTGTLTPAELEKTKIHSTIGAAILENIDFKYPVVDTIKYHHEFWDGSGYPERLVGDDIPFTARILTIADAYDTLRCDRPYRVANSRDEARKHLLAGAGKQFDPTVVHVFLKHLTNFETMIDQLGLSYKSSHELIHDTDNGKPKGYVQQIKLANKEVFTLYELAREFGSSVRIEDTLALFTKKIREFVPFETCAIFLLDESGHYADVLHAEGENSELLLAKRIHVGEGATGFVLKRQETILNINPDLDFSLSQIELAQEYATMASLPLVAAGELIGAVSIYSRELAHYADEHIRLLETVSRIAAEAIGKSKQHDEAKVHALTDPMTGLPNARSLQMQFEREVARAGRGNNGFQVLMLDLDGFKAVNDSYGHKAGDKMLNEIGQVILEQLREYDFLARYGGDEFVALISDASSEDVVDLCGRIEKAVGEFELPVGDGMVAKVGVSLGAAGYLGDGITFDQMIVAADKAMYERKTRRKLLKAATAPSVSAPLSEFVTKEDLVDMNITVIPETVSSEGFIVELDESHVVRSAAIN